MAISKEMQDNFFAFIREQRHVLADQIDKGDLETGVTVMEFYYELISAVTCDYAGMLVEAPEDVRKEGLKFIHNTFQDMMDIAVRVLLTDHATSLAMASATKADA